MTDKPKIIGWSWFDGGMDRRPVYGAREIRRGKKKGNWEITIRKGATKFKKLIVPATFVHLEVRETAEYTYDNRCPLCGLWLFHDETDCPNARKK